MVPSVPASTPPPTLNPKDFTIGVKILEKQCFDTAGCDLVYQISPTYNGAQDISTGSWDVTYEVDGSSSGPIVNTFTMTNGTASFDKRDTAQTATSATQLTAHVTSVSANS